MVRMLRGLIAGLLVSVVLVVLLGVSPAFASPVWWGLTSGSWPANLPSGPSGSIKRPAGVIVVTAQNRGYENADGGTSPIVVKDVLPEGLTPVSIEGIAQGQILLPPNGFHGAVNCSLISEHEGECRFEKGPNAGEEGLIGPSDQIEVHIKVKVKASASSSEENTVSVSGGGAFGTSRTSRPINVNEEATRFGVENYEFLPEEEGGAPSTQAGAHPFQLTNMLALNVGDLSGELNEQEPAALTKDLSFQVPPGLIGNPTVFPQCTDAQFTTPGVGNGWTNTCPPQTAIGTATITYNAPGGGGFQTSTVPLFNLAPSVGEPARFGFSTAGPTTLDTLLRTGDDYGVTVNVNNITEIAGFMVSKLIFWGVPGDPRHDSARGWACIDHEASCKPEEESKPPPLLSLPTACTGPMLSTVQADSWLEPEPANRMAAPLLREYEMGGLDGCNHLQFAPEVGVTPDGKEASTPSGLTVSVHLPQESVLNGKGIAESTVKELRLQFPEGVTLNPSDADGLEACSEEQIGYLPAESSPGALRFTSGEPSCPNASKIGELEIETPLLPHALKGFVYLATPAPFGEPGPLGETGLNPYGSLLSLYIVAKDPVSGTLIKLPVRVALNQETGRVEAISEGIPDLPFETLRLHMYGEERAPLSTPGLCGTYTTVATFTPWSGEAPVIDPAQFQINTGPNKSACPNPNGEQSLNVLPFNPSLTAGSTSIQAGGFSPFTMTMSREDGNQDLKAVTLHMPPGLSGLLSNVTLCGELQANAGTCGPESEIGKTIVSVGLGNSPYTVTGGKVYITGPYEGAPFGLSVVTPANAGPFHLGNVIVRARIEVNPYTAALTIATDDSGPYAIPPMIKGIPLQIKHINVTVDRPGFTFNPTNCDPMAITGALSSIQGASSTVSVPFQATNCATLGFKPKFAVSTSGKTSRANGASLVVKVSRPSGSLGSEANFAKVKVDLPKQLPSRLSTLQKACTAGQFESNPAGCPSASIVGHVKVVTPLLPVPLEGPAYFVSHGGEAFPSLIFVLQGDNVTIDVVSTTYISKAGVTSATLKAVPDAPFTSFELTFQQGKYSALAANGNLCASTLKMPTAFVAQSGAEIHQATPITVTGCPKHKRAKKGKKAEKTGRAGTHGKGAQHKK